MISEFKYHKSSKTNLSEIHMWCNSRPLETLNTLTITNIQIFKPKPLCPPHQPLNGKQHTRRRAAVWQEGTQISQSFHLKFRKDEDRLYHHLKSKPNPGAFLKEHIRNDLENPIDLYAQLFSDIERDYGSMKKFLQICGIETIRNRLRPCTKAQREQLIRILKEKHKELRDLWAKKAQQQKADSVTSSLWPSQPKNSRQSTAKETNLASRAGQTSSERQSKTSAEKRSSGRESTTNNRHDTKRTGWAEY